MYKELLKAINVDLSCEFPVKGCRIDRELFSFFRGHSSYVGEDLLCLKDPFVYREMLKKFSQRKSSQINFPQFFTILLHLSSTQKRNFSNFVIEGHGKLISQVKSHLVHIIVLDETHRRSEKLHFKGLRYCIFEAALHVLVPGDRVRMGCSTIDNCQLGLVRFHGSSHNYRI